MGGLLASDWASYAEKVIPAGAPELQYIESRRAFYAGAGTLLGILLKALEPGSEPTEQDLALMDQIKAELDEFNADVVAGRA